MMNYDRGLLLDAWTAWARGYPKRRVVSMEEREYGRRVRVWLDEWGDWLEYWRRYSGWDWIVTVEPTNFIEHGVYSRIFIDIDGAGCLPRVAKALEREGVEYWVLESGHGYHVYVEFTPVKLGDLYREAAIAFLRDRLGAAYECIDESAIRIPSTGRPPLTFNTSAGRRVCLYDSGDECWRRGFTPPVNDWLADELKDRAVDAGLRGQGSVRRVAPGYFRGRGFRDWPRCIQEMVKRLLREGELEHIARVHLASFLLRVGVDPHLVFYWANDYREWKTQYHLDYTRRGGYYALKCRRVAALGYCPYYDRGGPGEMRRCPFYPWVEAWLDEWGDSGGGED